ncbi:hypothetical protein ABGB18_22410 [Nonomuraea sp. B12E4]|uniref:hypothetical protein n=1 Tax=Nonomuraea sp. B12E4 TaxID=3153564 RepID=UPI00325E28BE
MSRNLSGFFARRLEEATEPRELIFAERRGMAEGMMLGEIVGRVRALLVVLEARGLQISWDQRIKIESCVDNYQLTAWTMHAVTAETADEIFGEVI